MMTLAFILLVIGVSGIAATFVLHPLWVWISALVAPGPRPVGAPAEPTVSVVVAFRGGDGLFRAKVGNLLATNYPDGKLEVIFVSDGPLPASFALPESFAERAWKLLATEASLGKNAALNHGAAHATGEILVFTDLDAKLDPDGLSILVTPFADPMVGGVCGRRVVRETEDTVGRAQSRYIDWDSWIKRLESRLGFLSSNDGKLYGIRRALFTPLPGPVTDDLFNALTVISAGAEMRFAPKARARIPKPSRDARHEFSRRRRIIARSLYGIYLRRRLLNPFRYGRIAVAILLNKVFRRMLPLFLVCVLAASILGAAARLEFALLLAAQAFLYGAAALHPMIERWNVPKPIAHATALAFYFVVGNFGMLLGVLDFLRGKRVSRWNPRQSV